MMQQRDTYRRIGQCALFVFLLLLSGCVTVSFTVDSTVGSDGTIQTYDIKMDMSQSTYDTMKQSVESEGYSSMEEYFRDEASSSFGSDVGETLEYSETVENGNVTIQVVLKEITSVDDDSLSTSKENGTMVYEDQTFTAYSDEDIEIPVKYTLTMPGEITNSNADVVEGDTATWNLTSEEAKQTTIYAKSEISSGSGLLSIAGSNVYTLVLVAVPTVCGLGLFVWYWRFK